MILMTMMVLMALMDHQRYHDHYSLWLLFAAEGPVAYSFAHHPKPYDLKMQGISSTSASATR